jgi:hypothetical protein
LKIKTKPVKLKVERPLEMTSNLVFTFDRPATEKKKDDEELDANELLKNAIEESISLTSN